MTENEPPIVPPVDIPAPQQTSTPVGLNQEAETTSTPGAPASPPPAPTPVPTGGSYFDNLDGKKWAMFLHLSQFAGLLVPGLGFAAPIVIWQINKEKFPELEAHGKMVTNWIISLLIYSVAASIISAVTCGIGVFLFIPIALAAIIFPILGGIKAGEGVFWPYPITISFLK
jgi:uncharacterized Tic20 family protein